MTQVPLPEPGITTALVLDEVGSRVPMRLIGAYYTADQMLAYGDARAAEVSVKVQPVDGQ